MKSSLEMSRVEATSPPVLTRAPEPNTTPLGLTRNTRPLAVRRPAISEGMPPVTRLSSMLLTPGWLMSTRFCPPIENVSQLTMARSLVCCRAIAPGVARFWVTEPLTGLNPVGSSATAQPGAIRHASVQASGCRVKMPLTRETWPAAPGRVSP
ncbi:hypothetical protein D3C81_1405120 [compost metagenome]